MLSSQQLIAHLKRSFRRNNGFAALALWMTSSIQFLANRLANLLPYSFPIKLNIGLLLFLGKLLRGRERFAESARRFERAIEIYEVYGVRGGKMQPLRVYLEAGDVRRTLGDLDVSRQYYEYVVGETEDIDETVAKSHSKLRARSRALGGLGRIHQWKGDYENALERFQMALKICEGVISDEIESASSRCNIGWVYYHVGDLNSARREAALALSIYKRYGRRRRIVDALNLLAATYHMVDPERAIDEHLEPAIKICAEERYSQGKVLALAVLGLAYLNKGDFQKALEKSEEGLRAAKKGGFKEHEANISSNIGWIYHRLNDKAKAEQYHDVALSRRIELGLNPGIAESYGFLAELSLLHGSDADCYMAIRRGQDALSLLDKTRMRYYECRVRVLLTLGQAFKKVKDFPEAERCLEEARALSESIDYRHGIAMSYAEMAELYQWKGEYDKSFSYLKQGLEIADTVFPEIIWKLCSVYGDTYKALGDKCVNSDLIKDAEDQYGQAYNWYARAISEIEEVRGRILPESFKILFTVDKLIAYEKIILLSLQQGAADRAFEYVQRAKSRALIDLLAGQGIGIKEELVAREKEELENLLQEERALKNSVEELYFQLRGGMEGIGVRSSESNGELEQELHNKKNEWHKLWEEIRRIDPEFASLKQTAPLSISQLRELIPNNAAIVEYFIAGEKILFFVLTWEMSAPFACELDVSYSLIKRRVEDCQYNVARKPEKKEKAAWLKELWPLEKLWEELIAPIYSVPLGKNGKALEDFPVWYVIPHGQLYYLPFHSFCKMDKGEIVYLVERHKVIYLPAASVIKHCRDKYKPSLSSCFVAYGPSRYMKTEADMVAELFNVKSFQATEDVVRKQTCDKEEVPLRPQKAEG